MSTFDTTVPVPIPPAFPTMPEIMEPIGKTPQQSIFEKAVQCIVTLSDGIGKSKQLRQGLIHEKSSDLDGYESSAPIEVKAKKDRIRVRKQLLESPEQKAISKLDGAIRGYLYNLSLPSPFKSGVYLVPIVLIPDVEKKLREFQEQRKSAVTVFKDVLESRIVEAAADLGPLFDPGDYPSPETLEKGYTMEWQYVNFSVPGRLKAVSAQFFEQEKEKMAEKVKQATEEVTIALRAGFQKLVAHMANSLQPNADGTRKKFYDSTIENIQQFLSTFNARNIVDDNELSSLVNQTRNLLDGVDPKALRKDESVRQNLASSFQVVTESLDRLMVNTGGRQIFGEDEI